MNENQELQNMKSSFQNVQLDSTNQKHPNADSDLAASHDAHVQLSEMFNIIPDRLRRKIQAEDWSCLVDRIRVETEALRAQISLYQDQNFSGSEHKQENTIDEAPLTLQASTSSAHTGVTDVVLSLRYETAMKELQDARTKIDQLQRDTAEQVNVVMHFVQRAIPPTSTHDIVNKKYQKVSEIKDYIETNYKPGASQLSTAPQKDTSCDEILLGKLGKLYNLPDGNHSQEMMQSKEATMAKIIEMATKEKKNVAKLEDESFRLIQKMQHLETERARLVNEATRLEEELMGIKSRMKMEFEQTAKERDLLKQREVQWQSLMSGLETDLSQHKQDKLKLKEEMEKNEVLTSKVAKLTSNCEHLQQTLENSARVRQAQFNEELESYRTTIEASRQEIQKLKSTITEYEKKTTSDGHKKESVISNLESRLQDEITKNKAVVEKHNEVVSRLQESHHILEDEARRLRSELEIQKKAREENEILLRDLRSDMDTQVEKRLVLLKQQVSAWKDKHARLEEDNQLLKERTEELEELRKSTALLKGGITSREEELKGLRQEVLKLRKGLEDSLSQLATAVRRDENLIDRRLVVKMIVSYFESDSKKRDVLDLMSKILKFTEEEKIKVGLISRPGSWYSLIAGALAAGPSTPDPSDDIAQGSLADMWVAYLQKEAENAKKEES
eukprot:TRINITY_DN4483_c0_g1_i4.p1 TRINITY_DN4483_c0_g1~~TRINITY_DN4483_c0_g1_i4.p1  ORF type:complete len:673 (+),score=182.50 TRINITY_DN4483_c0_g1_i4:627-2645(+)